MHRTVVSRLSARTLQARHNVRTVVERAGADRTRSGLPSTSSTDFSLSLLRTKFGERSFCHTGPAAWNDLPEDMRAVADTAKFRKQLKTYFFTRAFNVQ